MKRARRRSQLGDRSTTDERRLSSGASELLAWLKCDGGDERVLRTRYDALVEALLAQIEQNAQPKAVVAYLRVRKYIEKHYLTLHTVEEVARACKVNRMYLSRLFRRFAGTGAYQFLTRLKMNKAAELLCEEGMTVKEAAEAMGFTDPFHFSRVFKRVYGVAPERFARRRRAEAHRLSP